MIGVRLHYEGGFATSPRDSLHPDLWKRLCSYWSPATYSSRDQNTSGFGHGVSAGFLRTRIQPQTNPISIAAQPIGAAWNFGTGRDRYFKILRDHTSCGLEGDKSWTLAAWINPSTVSSAMGIVKLGTNTTALNAMALYISAVSSGQFSAEWSGNGARSNASVLTANVWQHVAATKISGAINTTTTLYLNGKSIAIASASANTPNVSFTGNDNIGRFASGGGDAYGGYIGDVGVWSRAFKPSEIMALACGASPLKPIQTRRKLYISIPLNITEPLVGKPRHPNLFYSPAPARRSGESINPKLWSQLKCIWSPAHSKNDVIKDYGPLGFNMSIQGNAKLVPSEAGMAISMDGTPGTYATSSRAFTSSEYAALTGSPYLTFAAWVKPDPNHKGCIVKFGDSQSSLAGLAMFVNVTNSGVISMSSPGNDAWSASVDVFAGNQWVHLAATKLTGALNTTTKLYVNGNQVSLSASSSSGNPNVTTGGNVELGRFNTNFTNNPPATNENYKGLIGEVGIWFRVLTQKEIQMLATGKSPLQRKAKLPRWAQSKLIPHRVQTSIMC